MSDYTMEIIAAINNADEGQLLEVFGDAGIVGEAARDALQMYGYKITRIEGEAMSGWAASPPEGAS